LQQQQQITTGHAQQWGAVKAKKTKKVEAPAVEEVVPVFVAPVARGNFSDRGGRGGARGGFGTSRVSSSPPLSFVHENPGPKILTISMKKNLL
jgi:hypothetical protein